MSNPLCDQDPGRIGSDGRTYYERTGVTAADPDTAKSKLKAYTTNVASMFCEQNYIRERWDMVKDIQRRLDASRTDGTIVAKGGLALHHSIHDLFQKWAWKNYRDVDTLENARDYILATYAATSDLDTGVSVDSRHVDTVVQLVLESIEHMRTNVWVDKDSDLQAIVNECNRDTSGIAADLGAADVVFTVDPQSDQRVVLASSGGDCLYNECVVVEASGQHPIFISDNESLMFQIGHNVADFYLIRAKWAISATCTYPDGTTCTTTCPAELLDVAIPRENDSRKAAAATLGTDHLKVKLDVSATASVNVGGKIVVPMVSMKYQLMDLLEMCIQSYNGSTDPKIAKRIHRYIILKFINNLLVYLTDTQDNMYLYNKFRTITDPSLWRRLVSVGFSDEYSVLHDWMHDTLKATNALDTTLIRHLFKVRDIIIDTGNTGFTRDMFSGVGAQTGGASTAGWHAAAALAAVTLTMSFLGAVP
jgi:hypothetical protein